MSILIGLSIAIVFALGTWQILQRDIIRIIVGFALQSLAVNLLIITAGALPGLRAPFAAAGNQSTDPLVQALVLTAIVIFLGVFILLLVIAYRLFEEYGSLEVDDYKDLKE
jgi:multicomponent Na+:H+ antiporter subunit C